MPRPRPYSRHLSADDNRSGFSAIAPAFWKTAEKLKTEAVQATAQQDWKVHWTIPSAICLYHAALDCFINEEIAIAIARAGAGSNAALARKGRSIQDKTLSPKKLERFFSFFALGGKATTDVRDRTLLFISLRNLLYHHAPEMRDIRDYPDKVIAVLKDAGIDPVNTSWAGPVHRHSISRMGVECGASVHRRLVSCCGHSIADARSGICRLTEQIAASYRVTGTAMSRRARPRWRRSQRVGEGNKSPPPGHIAAQPTNVRFRGANRTLSGHSPKAEF
jgi:hypothetical protein